MKRILLIFLLVLVFLAGCKTQVQETKPIQEEVQCPQVNKPESLGCEVTPVYNWAGDCIINYDIICPTKPVQDTTQAIKGFTIEADDLGLYPETLTVNKCDKVKITFKVRQDKVYYGGLDFKSDYFKLC